MEICPSPFAVRPRITALGGTSIFAKPGIIPVAIPQGRRACGTTTPVTTGSYAPPVLAPVQVVAPKAAPQFQVRSPSKPAHVAGTQLIPVPRGVLGGSFPPFSTGSLTPTGSCRAIGVTRIPTTPGASLRVVTSGSYVPPVSGSYTAPPPLVISGSYASPASGSYAPPPLIVPTGSWRAPPASGSYAPPPLIVHTGSYSGPPVLMRPAPMVIPAPIGIAPSGSYAPPPILAPPLMIAPSGSYAPPPMTAPSGSYAPPPRLIPSGSYVPPSPALASRIPASGSYRGPVPPSPALAARIPASGSYCGPPLEELPNPDTVEKQKEAYRSALDRQFHTGLAQIGNEREAKREFLRQQAEQAKAQFALQVQSQLDTQHLALDSGLNCRLMEFQESAMVHRKNLEEKAAALTLDYQQKKASEELLQRQYMIQKHYIESELKIATEFTQKQGSIRAPPIATSMLV